jgi:hypothetical protein
MTALGIIQVLLDIKRPSFARSEGQIEDTGLRELPLPEGTIIFYIFVAVAIVWVFGLIFGLSVFLLLYLRFVSKLSWAKNICISLGTALFYYVFFNLILQIRFPGLLGILF